MVELFGFTSVAFNGRKHSWTALFGNLATFHVTSISDFCCHQGWAFLLSFPYGGKHSWTALLGNLVTFSSCYFDI